MIAAYLSFLIGAAIAGAAVLAVVAFLLGAWLF
jgi:hypothetical protein